MQPYWTDDQATIWHANALDLPLPDASVDLVVTSPPYFGLRSYQDAGEHYSGQLGSEPTPAEFVDALIAATREMVRVLKPSGSLWINLGDKYASGGRAAYDLDPGRREVSVMRPADGARPKSLLGIPWRYALRCIDDLGLILRAEVIWSKPNGLPESVTDRVRRSHEQWFHFVREPRYYSAVDEVREESSTADHHARYGPNGYAQKSANGAAMPGTRSGWEGMPPNGCNPLGKLPGSVWTIPTQPLRVPDHLGVDHFAAFPMEWPRRIIRGWSPRDVCTACGEGRRPVVDQSNEAYKIARAAVRATTPRDLAAHSKTGRSTGASASDISNGVVRPDYRITGYACACPDTSAPTTPGVVLDPFGGTGTTALVAAAEGRTAHHVDLSADYCRLARWRITDPGERARAREVEKPAVEMDGQDDLLGLLADG